MIKVKNNLSKENTFDRKIVLSIGQLMTYSAFLITIGASIYTFFKAIPKIEILNERVNELKVSNSRIEERIISLREIISEKKNK